MDVRCENCQTEYELDGSRLKPGGVTVKCTACGHMFKVRKRTAAAPSGAGDEPSASLGGGEDDRTWLIRLEDGEIKTCRELATLQQWIVAREVGRSAEISRTGKKWKRLGDIGELDDFFRVAEEADRRRASPSQPEDDDDAHPTLDWEGGRSGSRRASTVHPRVVPSRGSAPHPAQGGRTPSVPPPPPSGAAPPDRHRSPTSEAPEPAAPAEPLSATDTARGVGIGRPPWDGGPPSPPPSAADSPAEGPGEATGGESPASDSEEAPAVDREGEEAAMARLRAANQHTEQRGATREPRRLYVEDEGPSGPTGGLARGIPTDDVAFAGGGFRPPPGGGGAGAEASVSGTHARRGGGAAVWILGGSIAVLGAAAVVMYVFVFSSGGAGSAAAPADADPSSPDASVVAAALDAGSPTVDSEALTDAEAAIVSGSRDALADAAEALEDADDHLESVVARSRVYAAWAQVLLDLAEFEGGGEARDLRDEANEHIAEARELAARARELDRDAVGALVATGEALRLSGRRARDVRRPLRRAFADEPGNTDAQLALALVLAEEGRERQAVRNLEELVDRAESADPPDPRPRVQLALMELESEEDEAARAHVEEVLAIASDHEVARAAAEILEDRGAVVAEGDPMPREEDGAGSDRPVSYEGRLQRANELAELGRCRDAMPLFRSALDANASGVEALTGLAYCHLDAREFASAQARFRSALSASPEYQPALYGVAEAYQQQGLADRAIGAYERYLEMHPNGTRADMARRQLERLGGESEADDPGGSPGSSSDGEAGGSADDPAEGGGATDDGASGAAGEEGGSDDGAGSEGGDDGEDDEPAPFLSEE